MSWLDSILFTVPGLMSYFWIEKMGITPAVKPSNLEQTAIGAILWVPTFLLATLCLKLVHKQLPVLQPTAITTQQIGILALFFAFSIFSSFIVSLLWSCMLYPSFLWIVNRVRRPLKRGKLSNITTVWEDMFISGKGMVVRIKKVGSDEKAIVGQIESTSRPLSGEQSIILGEQPFWEAVLAHGDVRVEYTFINTDKGIQIEKLSKIDLDDIVRDNPNLLLMPITSRRKR